MPMYCVQKMTSVPLSAKLMLQPKSPAAYARLSRMPNGRLATVLASIGMTSFYDVFRYRSGLAPAGSVGGAPQACGAR